MDFAILDTDGGYATIRASYRTLNDRTASDRTIAGVLLLTRTGILLHCLDDDLDREGFAPIVRKFLGEINVRCIIGQAKDTRWLETLIVMPPDRAVDYRLMILAEIPPAARETLPDFGDTAKKPVFVRAKPTDAERLMELQEGYEREEVMPPGDPFNRNTCLANLARNIAGQIVIFVRSGREIIAKAGTNARGIHWDQLGGVYTHPDWRGKGLATALVAHIARNRMQEGRHVALFVKIRNEPAIRAYEKAGFRPDDTFRIAYF